MTPTDIDRIRASWAAVEPIADAAAGLFYGRLFELDPAIERLFRRTDMPVQRKVLMQTLTDEGGSVNLQVLPVFSLLFSIPVVVLYLLVNSRYGFRFHGGIKS